MSRPKSLGAPPLVKTQTTPYTTTSYQPPWLPRYDGPDPQSVFCRHSRLSQYPTFPPNFWNRKAARAKDENPPTASLTSLSIPLPVRGAAAPGPRCRSRELRTRWVAGWCRIGGVRQPPAAEGESRCPHHVPTWRRRRVEGLFGLPYATGDPWRNGPCFVRHSPVLEAAIAPLPLPCRDLCAS